MIDISKDKPNLLLESKFENIDLELIYFRDESANGLHQQWKCNEFNISIDFDDAFLITKVIIFFSLENINLNSNTYSTTYKNFKPNILKNFETASKNFELVSIMDKLENEEWHWLQTWQYQESFLEITLNESNEILFYNFRENENDSFKTTHYNELNLIINKEYTTKEGNTISQSLYENGNLKSQSQFTKQGIRIGKSSYFDEDGKSLGEHDYELIPIHNIGFDNLKTILKNYEINWKEELLELKWIIQDENYNKIAEVDAVDGSVIIYEASSREKIKIQTENEEPFSCMKFIEQLVGLEYIYNDDVEIISNSASYHYVLSELQKISFNEVEWQDFEIQTEMNSYKILLKINNITETFELDADTDLLDNDFIKYINICLRKSKSKFTFYEFYGWDWEGDMAFIFLKDVQADCILDKIMKHQSDQPWAIIDNFLDTSSTKTY